MLHFAVLLIATADAQHKPAQPQVPAADELRAIVQRTLDEARAQDPDAELRAFVAQRGTMLVGCSAGGGKADPGLLLPLGALSHTFTAALALKLADEGKLSLERPLKEVLADIQPPLDTANLADALGGMLCLPRTPELAEQCARTADAGAWTMLFKCASRPREAHDADDAAWALVARACELAGGSPHMELVREHILAPLDLVEILPAPLKSAPGAIELPGAREDASSVELCASPQAMATWMQSLLARKLLSDQATRRYMTPAQLLDGNSTHCGMGIAQSKVAGLKRYRMESARGTRQLDLSYWSLAEVAVLVEARGYDAPVEELSRRLSLLAQRVEQPALVPVAYDRGAAARLEGSWRAAGRTILLRAGEDALVLEEHGRTTRLVPLADGAFGSSGDPEARWRAEGAPGAPAEALVALKGGYETRARRAP